MGTGVASAARRRQRSRRVEVSIVVLVLLLLLGWLASRAWLVPARSALPAAPATGGAAPATHSTSQSR
ncbi:MAG TPA: hypothetical protein VHN78_01270, partial [Chloroflexota bacterium]|nr:hypothetical protein [Chloroflexota bacterium]